MPKKKGGKKGAKIVDGIATSEMSREQLVGHVRRIQMELDREREERNFFMLEREKLFALWNIAMEQLHAQKVKTQLAVEQMTEHDEEKEMEVLMHKQKLRHLLTEQSKKVDEARLQNLKKLRKAQEDMLSIQNTLKESIDQKSKELRQSQGAMVELMRQMNLDNAKNVSKMRNDMCLEISRVERDFMRTSLEKEKRDELAIEHERELIKNKHMDQIELIKETHENEMEKLQSYFHSITINNLATITALQDEIKDMKEYEQKIIDELKKSNRELKGLENLIRVENKERKKVVSKDVKLKESIQKELKKMNELSKTKDRYARSMEVANEALLQKVCLVEDESKVFKRTIAKAILDMQQEAAMKKMILELKLRAASRDQRQLPPAIRKIATTEISTDADNLQEQ